MAVAAALALLAGVAALLEEPNAAGAASERCAARGSTTLARNRWARVYRSERNSIIGCVEATGRKRYLTYDDVSGGPALLVLRRTVVAYLMSYKAGATVTPADVALRTGEKRTVGRVFADSALDLQLTTHRRFAFVVEREDDIGQASGIYALYKRDRAGLTLLDESAELDPRSLRVSGAAIAWTHGGAPRSATFGP